MAKKSTLNNMVSTISQKVNNGIQVRSEGVRVDSLKAPRASNAPSDLT